MTDPGSRGGVKSTEVLLVKRARRRRAQTHRRQQLTVSLVGLVAVVALATAVVANGGDDGTEEVQVLSDGTTSTTGTTVDRLAATPEATSSPTSLALVAPAAICTTEEWSVEERVAMTVFATIEGSASIDEAIEAGYGGVFIPTASVGLVSNGVLKERLAAASRAPLSAIDEEGGQVQRLKGVIGAIPSAREMHDLGPDGIRQLAAEHGREMADLGLSMNFAPVVDLVEDAEVQGDGGIGSRSFSADPDEAAADAGAFAAGMADAGILATYKHFPGHGHASGDTHDGLAVTPDIATLEQDDLRPYTTLLGEGRPIAAVMIGHLVVPGLTDGLPASVSKAAIDGLLRQQLDFDGLVVTDDLGSMQGILDLYSTVEASVLAVAAGADMVLVPASDGVEVVAAISAAVGDGQIPEAQLTLSADRVLRAQQPGACPAP